MILSEPPVFSNWKLFTETSAAFKTGSAKLDTLTLNKLRTCLLREQRRHKWSMNVHGYEPNLGFMLALVSAIRADLNRGVQFTLAGGLNACDFAHDLN